MRVRLSRQFGRSGPMAIALAIWCAAFAAPRPPLDQTATALTRAEASRRAAALAAVGRQIFRDPTLSVSRRQSCASCHVPGRAFGPADSGAAIARGGADGSATGIRAVPALRYLQAVPPFSLHTFNYDDGREDLDQGPTGGLTWDGRVDRPRDQARMPLYSPIEMANGSAAAVAARLRATTYVGALRDAIRTAIDSDEALVDAALEALEGYEQDAAEFYPYTSKYDDVLRGRAALAPDEARGLAAFNDPARGNCARCHPSARLGNGTLPSFTDYGYAALGAPRNPTIAANGNPAYFDLGLCGPVRADLRGQAPYCGRFRTPTLRNVAIRPAFFHNGAMRTLRDAVAFYATRDSSPARWYPSAGAGGWKVFNDLPPAYQANVDRDPPFGRRAGGPPALTDGEIDDIVAFLKTLNDADVR